MSLKPMLDCGRFRSPCVTCDAEIPRGHPRLAEPCNDGRIPNAKYQYHCIECAMTRMMKLVRETLIYELFDEGIVPDATALKQELHDRIEATDAGRPVPPRRMRLGSDHRIESLMLQLYDSPDDRDVLGVLADALSERGDPRGELIVLDLAIAEAEGSEDQESRRRELRYRLLPRMCHYDRGPAKVTWGLGFIESVVLRGWTETLNDPFPDAWTHNSLRLVQDVSIGDDASRWLRSGLPALRRLEIVGGKLDKLPPLPRLEVLSLSGSVERDGAQVLATFLGDRKLAEIDITRARMSIPVREQLAQLCVELVK